ncbi:hypothetical protein IAE33_000280 [Pseudomonas sp. S60]|nr:hypothetical protein [Pseudomonas sp. S60]
MITSKQKKTLLPLAVFVASCAWYSWLLGGPWFFLAIPSMIGSFIVLLIWSIDAWLRVAKDWFNRDGWK